MEGVHGVPNQNAITEIKKISNTPKNARGNTKVQLVVIRSFNGTKTSTTRHGFLVNGQVNLEGSQSIKTEAIKGL